MTKNPDLILAVKTNNPTPTRAKLEALALKLKPYGHKARIDGTGGALAMLVECESSIPHVRSQLEALAGDLVLEGDEARVGTPKELADAEKPAKASPSTGTPAPPKTSA